MSDEVSISRGVGPPRHVIAVFGLSEAQLDTSTRQLYSRSTRRNGCRLIGGIAPTLDWESWLGGRFCALVETQLERLSQGLAGYRRVKARPARLAVDQPHEFGVTVAVTARVGQRFRDRTWWPASPPPQTHRLLLPPADTPYKTRGGGDEPAVSARLLEDQCQRAACVFR